MSTVRLATYNIHKFVGADGKRNVTRILDVIRALDADIVGIQEFVVDPAIPHAPGGFAAHSTNGTQGVPGAEEFAAAAGYRVVQQKMRRANGQYQRNLLLTRAAPRLVRLIDLVCEGMEPRGAICAEMEEGGQRFRVVTTHLGLAPWARKRQFETMLRDGAWRDRLPLALLGDFNASIPFGPVDRRLRRAFPGHARPASFPARWPIVAPDRIVVDPASAVRSLRAYREAPANIASDHLPLVADIVFS